MVLRLTEDDRKLEQLCRDFEGRVSSVAELAYINLPVVLKATFQDEPEAQRSRVIAGDQAAYRRSTGTIYINDSSFWLLPEHQRLSALAHEVGHALSHRQELESLPAFAELHDCQIADLLACRWGFHTELRAERAGYYGQGYADALDLWQDEPAYSSAMAKWRALRAAGLG